MTIIHNHNYNHHDLDPDHDQDHDHERSHAEAAFDQDWLCAICFRTISATRPPHLNLDNCSCPASTVGSPQHESDSYPYPAGGRPTTIRELSHQATMDVAAAAAAHRYHEPGTPSSSSPPRAAYHYPAAASVSASDEDDDDGHSTHSVRAPDGPEARDPNNRYLPLGPAVGLGEARHRRRASFDQLEHELSCAGPHHRPAAAAHAWLRQDPHLGAVPESAARATRASGSGSGLFSGSSGEYSGSSGFGSSRSVDPLLEAGAWVVEGDAAAGGGGSSDGAWGSTAWPSEIDLDDDDDNDDDLLE